jgi:hypothetical protein
MSYLGRIHRGQTGLGAHPASYPMGFRGPSLEVNRPGREAYHSPPSSAEVKECVELYLHSQYVFLAWCLVKHRENFIFFTLHFTAFYDLLRIRITKETK